MSLSSGNHPEWGPLVRRSAWLHMSGQWQDESHTWPPADDGRVPGSLFDATGIDVKPRVPWAKRDAIRRKQGRMVCSEHSVGIFGYRSCWYVPYPWHRRTLNTIGLWLDRHRGTLMPSRVIEGLVSRFYTAKYMKRLKRLQRERRNATGPHKTTSHFLLDREKGKTHDEKPQNHSPRP